MARKGFVFALVAAASMCCSTNFVVRRMYPTRPCEYLDAKKIVEVLDRYEIVRDSTLRYRDLLGETDPQRRIIRIQDPADPEDDQKETILHELLHAYDFMHPEIELPHDSIYVYARRQAQCMWHPNEPIVLKGD